MHQLSYLAGRVSLMTRLKPLMQNLSYASLITYIDCHSRHAHMYLPNKGGNSLAGTL